MTATKRTIPNFFIQRGRLSSLRMSRHQLLASLIVSLGLLETACIRVGGSAPDWMPESSSSTTSETSEGMSTTGSATNMTEDPTMGNSGTVATTDTTMEETTDVTLTGDTTTTGNDLPDAAVLQLNFSQIKQFDFSWSAAEGATYYQLLERLPEGADYVKLGEDIVGESISLTMPLHLRFGASYLLRACNDDGCTDSEPVDVVDSMATAVGYFKASNTTTNDQFGDRIAISADGNTLAVGALYEDSDANGIDGDQTSNSAQSAGAVYIFVRANNVWSQQAYIKASNSDVGDCFGSSVALSADGNTLAVGAYGEASVSTGIGGDQGDNSVKDAGAVYIFVRANNVWSQQSYIKASNTDGGDYFGWSVALSADGNTLAVGATGEDSNAKGINSEQANNSVKDAGAVYIFVRANNVWSQQSYIKASNTDMDDRFGFSIALSADGNTLAVGALYEDSNANGIDGNQTDNSTESAGAVYIFVRANNVWSQQSYIKASNTDGGDYSGFCVALSTDGNILAIGAIDEDSNANGIDGDQTGNSTQSAGAVYIFVRANNVWSQQSYTKASNTDMNDRFGNSVALSTDGNTLAVGAKAEDSAAIDINGSQANNTATDAGAVYLY